MHKILRLVPLLFISLAAAFGASPLVVGPVEVVNEKAIPIHVTASTAELQDLARSAFKVHGAYKLLAPGEGGAKYDIAFTATAANRVRVDVKKNPGGTALPSQELTGTSFLGSSALSNALLRAADVAVEKTNTDGLKGFFAAKLTFISERTGKSEIYVADLFFGDIKKLTSHNSDTMTPRWSPDGTKIVYTSYFKSRAPDIYQIDLSNLDFKIIVSMEGTNSGARFSPNGRELAMVLSGEGNSDIYVSPPEGRPVDWLTKSREAKTSPCFSPDGSRLVFSSGSPPQLYVMANRKNAAAERIAVGFNSYCTEPDWSTANPNKIAFTIQTAAKRFQIAVYDLSTRESKLVSKAAYDGMQPQWLPDGRHLVFTAQDSRTSALFILDTETGKAQPIGAGFGKVSQASVLMPAP